MMKLSIDDGRRFADKLTGQDDKFLASLRQFSESMGSEDCTRLIICEQMNRVDQRRESERLETIKDLESYLATQSENDLKGSYQQRCMYRLEALKSKVEEANDLARQGADDGELRYREM